MTNQPTGNAIRTSNLWVKVIKCALVIISISLFLISCGKQQTNIPNSSTATPASQSTLGIPSQGISPTAILLPEPLPTSTQSPVNVWLPAYLPEKIRSFITLPDGFQQAASESDADLSLIVENQNLPPVAQWIYVLVAPFPTIPDGVTLDELQAAWTGTPIPAFKGSPISMDSSTLAVLTARWGAPALKAVNLLPTDQLLNYAWAFRPSLSIVPFEKLEPRWKVLTIDGQSPIHKEFDPINYPLTIPFVLSGKVNIDPSILNIPTSNRDASKLTVVAMTGVTAMVRATAYTMELKGVTYPAEDIGALLSAADITHISNEIPFWPDCPYPSLTQDELVFCSSPKYIDLMKAVGTDIVELSGDHFMDYGADATLYTLQMYKDQGWPFFAGGANAVEARQPVKLENNGNKIAFMGCNVGCQVKPEIPCTAIATDTHPGAAQCDFNYISNEIPALRDEGYQVIFTFQHREYYTYTAQPDLVNDFGLVASAGAAIVSGSQAHQPHGFSFSDSGAYIHYGLGNLFFDQLHFCPDYACDDSFIDQHVFYDGHYISTELITIRFVDFAKPRLMTPEERQHLLELVFKASGW